MPRSKIPPEQRLKSCVICGDIFNYTGTNSKTCGKHGKHKTCRCATCGKKYIYIYGSKEANYHYCSVDCKKNKIKKERFYSERSCLICETLFVAKSHNQKMCPAHLKKMLKQCATCGINFSAPSTGCKRVGKYCSTACHPKKPENKIKITKSKTSTPLKPKPPILLPLGRQKNPIAKQLKNDACAVCAVPLQSKNYTQVYCSEHRYYHKKYCRYCKEAFHSPKAEKQAYCGEACRLNDLRKCQVCGTEFSPEKPDQVYCPTHNKGGPDANKYYLHWMGGAPATVGDVKKNPYKAGTIKQCEAIKRHPDCSGTMMVFANEWTRCVHCARMLHRQSASIKYVKDS